MKCNKCGNQMVNDVCPECGETYKNYINVLTDKEIKIKNLKINNIATLIIFVCIAAFIYYVGLGIRLTLDYGVRENVTFGENSIPTFYNVTGKKDNIKTFKVLKSEEIIKYSTTNMTNEDLEKYVLKLYELDFHDIKIDEEKRVELVKKAKEDNKLLKVVMYPENNTLVFEYYYISGKLEDYGIVEQQKVGSNELGYIHIPVEYELEESKTYTLKYYNPKNKNEYVIIEKIKNKSFDDVFKEVFTSTCVKRNVILHGITGVELSDETIDSKNKIYIFDRNGESYYLKFSSNNKESLLFDSIYTYSFTY